MNVKSYFPIVFVTFCIFAGCAVDRDETSNSDSKKYLDAWIHVNFPDAEYDDEEGIYILSEGEVSASDGRFEPVEGKEGDALGNSGYAFVSYTVRDLNSTVSETSDEKIAEQVGGSLYGKSYYFGPRIWGLEPGTLYKGLGNMLDDMKIGERRTALIPGWLLTFQDFDSIDDYIENITGNSHLIYDVKVMGKTDDVKQWQLDSLERFSELHLKNLGTEDAEKEIRAPEEGFYYKQLKAPDVEDIDMQKDTVFLHKDTTVYINYTGRLLNGQVFDTTIKDTAKVYNIYSTSNIYEPISVSMSSDINSITMTSASGSSSTPILGFRKILWEMREMEKGVGVFYYGLGYGVYGSGKAIPEYAPLMFVIELVEKPE